MFQFEDPVPEMTGGARIKPRWEPGASGRVSWSEKDLTIYGASRLSIVERILSLGPVGEIFVKSFFETFFHHRIVQVPTSQISKVVASTKERTLTIFVEEADGRRDIHSFVWYHGLWTLWLLWGFLTRTVASDKLKLKVRKQEVHLKTPARSWAEEEMQGRIATATFEAFADEGSEYSLNELAELYEGFGAVGRQTALGMLSAEHPLIRAAASACLPRIAEARDADALLPLLEGEDPLVRAVAACPLGSFPSEKTSRALEETASQDEEKRVRKAAQKALTTMQRQ